MRGKPVGEQLEKVRAVTCARNGLRLVHDETPAEDEIDGLYELYQSSPETFVKEMMTEINKTSLDVLVEENPADAIKLCMLSGLLADRMTNRQLLESNGLRRTRSGVAFDNGIVHTTLEATPYHGKDVG